MVVILWCCVTGSGYGITLKVSKVKYKIWYSFIGTTLIFQLLHINVQNYCYFHTDSCRKIHNLWFLLWRLKLVAWWWFQCLICWSEGQSSRSWWKQHLEACSTCIDLLVLTNLFRNSRRIFVFTVKTEVINMTWDCSRPLSISNEFWQ